MGGGVEGNRWTREDEEDVESGLATRRLDPDGEIIRDGAEPGSPDKSAEGLDFLAER
jgi:hypothetical protein